MRSLLKPLGYTLIGTFLIALSGIVTYIAGSEIVKDWKSYDLPDQSYATAGGGYCNIAVIPLTGQLWASEADAKAQTLVDGSVNSSAERILVDIARAKENSSIKGVVLRVDSPGGSSVAGTLVANALKRMEKPSVALIWDQADSASYLAVTGASTIIASPNSDIGDIGVTGSYIDQSDSTGKSGGKFISIAAGTYKDVGNPNNPLTKEGYALLKKQVDQVYQNFIQEVATNRNMKKEDVLKVADGVSYVASEALDTGLIDSLGDSESARAWFETKLEKNSHPVLCE